MNERIKCSVDTCHYWSDGNRCEADAIMVAADAPAEGGRRLEAGASPGGATARSSSQTQCDTFRPR